MSGRFKTFVATVEIEFTCISEEMFLDHVESIGFGDNDCDYKIIGVREDKIDQPFLPFDQGHPSAAEQWKARKG